jgi:hypothetical protein
MTRRRSAFVVFGSAVAIAAVIAGAYAARPNGGSGPESGRSGSPEGPTSRITPAGWDGKGVPPVTLHLGRRTATLEPWAYCWENACVDGLRPARLEDVSSGDRVPFSFPEPGWSFEATFNEAGKRCGGRSITVPVQSTGPRTFELGVAGPAGTWDVDLFGRAPAGGDVIASFRWTTHRLGTLPEPDGYLGIISTTGGERHVYRPELALHDLASSPREATAVITVTAAGGASRTLPVLRAEGGCGSDGHVFFRGEDAMSAGLLDLGALPYTYSVELTLDGERYTGTAVYPDDEIKGLEPYATLTFDPPLPKYMRAG